MSPFIILNILLGLTTAVYAFILIGDVLKHKDNLGGKRTPLLLCIGFISDFLDTLGIGSFAISTVAFRATKTVDDKNIPGTLNAGHALPTLVEALASMAVIRVEPITLISMIVAAILGAFIGAGIVAKLPVKAIRFGMGAALLVIAGVMVLQRVGVFPEGGDAIGITGMKLAIAVSVNFVLGALMTIGIGLYAPCMALVYMLGMTPRAAFPIMMGSCAFVMPTAAIRFIKEGVYDRKAAICVALMGIAGVIVATYLVKSLPLDILTVLVIIVIIYTSATMIRDGVKG